MRTIVIILFIILTIWSIFGFETSNISLALKYFIANVLANPIKTILTLVGILGLATILCLFTHFTIIRPIRNQIEKIEPLAVEFKERNIKFELNSKTISEYIKIYDQLRSKKRLELNVQILKFIDDSKFVYSNLPDALKNYQELNTSIFNMNRVTQVTALKIEKYKHTILFISHNEKKADRQINFYKFDNLPENEILQTYLDSIFTDEILNPLRQNFEFWLKNNYGLHGSAGVALATKPNHDGEWMWIGVPEPFNENNNLSNLLAENVFLKGV